MKHRIFLLPLFLASLAGALSSQPASADGIIIPEPPICDPGPCPEPFPLSQLAIEYHHVTVSIEDQVAVTHVDQVFRNDQDWAVEGTYVFPLPADASVSSFTLWIDQQPVEAEILSQEEARQIYEDIVRQLRDPALLEYVDRGAVRASVFPIEPGEKRRIELEYTQTLPADQGLIAYSYPLNTEKFSTLPLEEVVISVDVRSQVPVRAVYSPSHPIVIDRSGDRDFKAGYEASNITPDSDFDLYYSVSMEDIGLNLLTYRDPYTSEEDGYFLLMAAPGFETDPEDRLPKDVLFVLDQSGSMEGEKFRQAQQAASYVLEHLQPGDRFNLLSFSTGVRSFSPGLSEVDAVPRALRWMNELAAMGATDINLALLEAAGQVDPGRTTLILFLTDGLPTEGVVDADSILRNMAQQAPENVRLFAFGVGYDVDTFLLDSLVNNHHGATTYVRPDQAIDEIISGFFTKVTTPVLTDLSFDAGEIQLYDLHPYPIPDLFAGSQVILTGRYRGSGTATLEMTGHLQQEEQTFQYPVLTFRNGGGPAFIPRLWATRKIGSLLNQIRLKGPDQETIDQIIAISIRYGVITPYTSFLVTEPDILDQDAQDTLAEEMFADELAGAPAVSGESAVQRASGEKEIQSAETVSGLNEAEAGWIRYASARTFRRVEDTWVDTQVDPSTADMLRVPFLSADYFELSASSPETAAALALGEKVILRVGDTVYQIVDSESPGDPLGSIPESLGSGDTGDAPRAGIDRGARSPFCPGIILFGLVFLPMGMKVYR